MIDHIGLAVKDMDRAKAFYMGALKPLGVGVIMEVTAEQTGADAHAGFGKDARRSSGSARETSRGAARMWRSPPKRAPRSIRFTAPLWPPAAGTMARRAQGPTIIEHYYGAFVLDPDGNNIEAVCHRPE